VDDMEPARAERFPAPRDHDRVVAVDRLAREVALGETHAAATAEIDGRIDDHPRSAIVRTNPASSARPTRWLFSGWKTRAYTLSRPTLETKSSPYSVMVATTTGSAVERGMRGENERYAPAS